MAKQPIAIGARSISGETNDGCWLRLGVDLPLQGGACHATTALLANQSIVYQRHDLSRADRANQSRVTTRHLRFQPARARVGFRSAHCFMRERMSSLLPGRKIAATRGSRPISEIIDLNAAPCIDGSTTDLCRYPARRGFEDLSIAAARIRRRSLPGRPVTFPEQRFVWFALRDPKQLASTLLWFSNGGRHFPPWNGRHVNVMGIEDITAYFHAGLAASSRENPLNARGVPTCSAAGCSRPAVDFLSPGRRAHTGGFRLCRRYRRSLER